MARFPAHSSIGHTPRNTAKTATITTLAQMAQMPAISRPCGDRVTRGGTSGSKILVDLESIIMGIEQSSFNATCGNLKC